MAMVGFGNVDSFCQRHWLEARRALAGLRILLGTTEVEPDVLAGAERLTGARDDEDLGLLVGRQLVECIVHVQMKLRAHGIALVGTIEDDPGDPTLPFDLDGLVLLVCHFLFSVLGSMRG
jgi:hypothetical protein